MHLSICAIPAIIRLTDTRVDAEHNNTPYGVCQREPRTSTACTTIEDPDYLTIQTFFECDMPPILYHGFMLTNLTKLHGSHASAMHGHNNNEWTFGDRYPMRRKHNIKRFTAPAEKPHTLSHSTNALVNYRLHNNPDFGETFHMTWLRLYMATILQQISHALLVAHYSAKDSWARCQALVVII